MIQALFNDDEQLLQQGWELAMSATGTAQPDTLDQLEWHAATVPGTAAEVLLSKDPLGEPPDLDAIECWYRCRFTAEPGAGLFVFDGLATLADVWLNGQLLLSSDNMFIPRTADIELLSENELLIRFRSLDEALSLKRSRAKWRTPFVSHRNLRFIRTTLLGRMPGICPRIPPVGPWLPIRLLRTNRPVLESHRITPRLTADGKGEVDIHLILRGACETIESAEVLLDDQFGALELKTDGDRTELTGRVTIEDPELWWPHTHGAAHRYPLSIRIQFSGSGIEMPLPAVGFRALRLTDNLENFEIAVNGQPVHCRGACWMPMDLISLRTDIQALREVLIRCREAGMNMLRVSGTTIYESDEFYELCDELGILVWQDFMFARMDYPTEDADFRSSIETEADSFLDRVGYRPSLAVLCGGSEIQQQAAMLGLPGHTADDDWFDNLLPALCNERRPDTIYCPHSPTGGDMPFHSAQGISHYFAIGAYEQALTFAELEPPRFASECLTFSIPPPQAEVTLLTATESGPDWSRYEARTPRDSGADWSFADTSDHYLESLFSVDARELRARYPALYLAATGIAVGEVMGRTLSAWRRNERTTGALVLTLNDLEEGAGWGILDHHGRPKAPYYFLKRTWQPVSLWFRDRGTNGLWLGLHNDHPNPLTGRLKIELGRLDGRYLEENSLEVSVAPGSRAEWSVDALLGGFVDANWAYRFGPQTYEIAIATFTSESGQDPVTEYFLLKETMLDPEQPNPAEIQVLDEVGTGEHHLHLSTDHFIDYLMLDFPDATVSDNYFPLMPGRERAVRITPSTGSTTEGLITAFNGRVSTPVTLGSTPR